MTKLKRWPVIPPLFTGEVILTEKLDGFTVGIHIERLKYRRRVGPIGVTWAGPRDSDLHTFKEVGVRHGDVLCFDPEGSTFFLRVSVQTPTKWLLPDHDHAGVARWVQENAAALAAALGEGIHFGVWWGYKINRGYGLGPGDRRLSLFNTQRWAHLNGTQVDGLHCTPVLLQGSLEEEWLHIPEAILDLEVNGSHAAPGYDRPEGVVLWHANGDAMFKHQFARGFAPGERKPRELQFSEESGL